MRSNNKEEKGLHSTASLLACTQYSSYFLFIVVVVFIIITIRYLYPFIHSFFATSTKAAVENPEILVVICQQQEKQADFNYPTTTKEITT